MTAKSEPLLKPTQNPVKTLNLSHAMRNCTCLAVSRERLVDNLASSDRIHPSVLTSLSPSVLQSFQEIAMRSSISLVAFLCLSLGIGNSHLLWADHVHEAHPTTPHGSVNSDGGRWVRIFLNQTCMTRPDIVLGAPEIVVAISTNVENLSCGDAVIERTLSTTQTHSVSVSGSYEVGSSAEIAAKALFGEIKGSVQAKITVGASLTVSESVTLESKALIPTTPCVSRKLSLIDSKRTATGTIECWDCEVTCKCTGCQRTDTTYCNKKTISGSGTGWFQSDIRIEENLKPTNCANCQPVLPPTPNLQPVPDPLPPIPPTTQPTTTTPTTTTP